MSSSNQYHSRNFWAFVSLSVTNRNDRMGKEVIVCCHRRIRRSSKHLYVTLQMAQLVPNTLSRVPKTSLVHHQPTRSMYSGNLALRSRGATRDLPSYQHVSNGFEVIEFPDCRAAVRPISASSTTGTYRWAMDTTISQYETVAQWRRSVHTYTQHLRAME